MTTNPFITIGTGLGALLLSPALAIEAPADNAPPPPPAASPAQAREAAAPEQQIETAFLGVVSSELPDMFAEHLDIEPGKGVVVRAVIPDGPGAKAGLAVNDIIVRVGGNIVGSAQDLTREVTSHQPGDKVPFHIIHKGEASDTEVTLGTRPADLAMGGPAPLDQLNLDGVPEDIAKRVRGMIQQNLGNIQMPPGQDLADIAPQMEDALLEMQLRMQRAMGNPDPAAAPEVEFKHDATIRLMDNDGSVEVKSRNGGKEVTVRDKDNNVTWTGPWDTQRDKDAAPAKVRDRLDGLNLESNKLELKFGR